MFKRIVWFIHAECDYDTHECDLHTQCDFDMQKCDNDTHDYDFNTHKSEFYMQSVIMTRTRVTLKRNQQKLT
jgi:hypothetical protein